MDSNNTKTVAVISSGILGAITLYWWWKKRGLKIPQRWREIGTLEYLAIYPLKSAAAITLEKAYCSKHCLQAPIKAGESPINDRSIVIYDESTQRFITGRVHPKVILIKVVSYDKEKEIITLEAPNMPSINIHLPQKGKTITCTFFGEEIETLDCGDEPTKWICEYLECKTARFGFYNMNINAIRKTVGPWVKFLNEYDSMKNMNFGLFSDMAPYLLLSKNSINDLNQRLEKPITHRNFRGNFLINGPKAFEEDQWKWVRIGSKATFKFYKPCTRCLMTTIDPDEGVKSEEMQPLKTLKSYRQLTDPKIRKLEGDSPVMGNLCGVVIEGEVKVGDKIYIPDE